MQKRNKESVQEQDSSFTQAKNEKSQGLTMLKLTNFRKQFPLSPDLRKKIPRKLYSQEDYELGFNNIQSKNTSQSTKFKEIVQSQKNVGVNIVSDFRLSQIEESDTETKRKESSINMKMSAKSIALSTDTRVKSTTKLSVNSNDTCKVKRLK